MEKERRINKRLLSYWNQLKEQGGSVPLEEMLQPEDINDVWDNCFIITPKSKKFSYIGKNLSVLTQGQGLIAHEVYSQLLSIEDSNIMSIANEVIKNASPITQESEFVTKYGVTVRYRRCLLPLANKSGKIDNAVGGLRWKTV